jgi:hypothetical protein
VAASAGDSFRSTSCASTVAQTSVCALPYPLKLPNSVKKAAQRLAKEDGVSLNQWIAAAVAEKVGVMETATDFIKKRAGKAKGGGLMRFLRNAPRVASEPEDQSR